jgi:Flp pilus assembly protein TadD
LLTVEGQAGAVLIRDLNGAGVAAVEYVQVGRALGASGDLADAIAFTRHALTAPPNDALTHAEALRLLGSAYYTAGQITIAYRYEMQATHFPSLGHTLENPSYIHGMIAYA